MKTQLTHTDPTLAKPASVRQSLYNSYAAALLGYIYEVVKDKKVAEQYLVEVFNELQFTDIAAITAPGVNTFCSLQAATRKKLASYVDTVKDCADVNDRPQGMVIKGNKFVDLMTTTQQQVFCGIHYHGKSITSLATELNKPETDIKQILRDSFNIIRNQRNDTATVHR